MTRDLTNNISHINYALVESTRPAMYTAMKYWGKKPHNIWAEFIKNYCPENGIVLDPFVGSGIAAFESLALNRKVIAFDLNPISSFFIDVYMSKFDENMFSSAANHIIEVIKNDPIYAEHYTRTIGKECATIYNYLWRTKKIRIINAKNSQKEPINFQASPIDAKRVEDMNSLTIPFWFPTGKLPAHDSINSKFISEIGGDTFDCLWTRRNLYLLAKIFHLISETDNNKVQLQLLYAFIHTLHLVSKMVVPRGEKGGRPFSGSWGRADYMIRTNSMEQNPLIIFERACFDKQGVKASLSNAANRLPQNVKSAQITTGKKLKLTADINYGSIDVADLLDTIPPKSVDFIITDPPYGGLVQYLSLSQIWLVWLEKYNEKYHPNPESEVTVNKGSATRSIYRKRLTNAFVNMHKVLKDDGYLVVTFHSKEMKEWNDFTNAVRNAGFKFDKVTHQYNRRSGESNVSDPYGTAASDFYIRCVKNRAVDFSDDKSELSHFIVQKVISIIAERAEPTPYTFIENGVLPELLQAGFLRPGEPGEEIQKILQQHTGSDAVFSVTKNRQSKSGDLWWFNNPSEHINYPDIPLSSRVDEAVLAILRRRISVKLDDTLAELFRMYPNGLTPDPRSISKIFEKYAFRASGKWKLKADVINEITKHTSMLEELCKIGKKLKYKVFIGKREQPERTAAGRLVDNADYASIDFLIGNLPEERIARASMIDCIYFDKESIICLFEVENSTNFSTAIIRASNLKQSIPKYMVIPDTRQNELKRFTDPLFAKEFAGQSWKYILYSSISQLSTRRSIAPADVDSMAIEL